MILTLLLLSFRFWDAIFANSYGVYIFQLICFASASTQVNDNCNDSWSLPSLLLYLIIGINLNC